MNSHKIFIIAEAGVNHNGDIAIAKNMIDIAKKSGVDAIKFQTYKSENVVSRFADKTDYQKNTTGNNESQLEMVKKLELSEKNFCELLSYCKMIGITFLSSPFDLDSVMLLDKLGLDTIKIPSGEITNLPYLRMVGKLNKKVILSTGMSNLQEVEFAVNILKNCGTNDITVLQCNTEYPTPYEDVNLMAMLTIKEKLGVEIGYSDHTNGIEVPIAAVALGARIIEKHFTLDRNMVGPDHKASLEPDELKAMVEAIRNIEVALGNGIKKPSQSEIKNINIARKSIVANCNIKSGEVYTEKNITVKRPGNGISPMKWDEVLGNTAVRDFSEDELIEI